ncbi:hypothetical protein M153_3140006112 [Pseudoloma neurophilia]|uniref:Uncharacterized protein n=1 Tax=Pseudoloma neurophilia TaxID=146866 RepID=A0A0R0LYT5_9MICR|nr:hypothetical protein M153_3140006112 [Pseudoloma neurophilia]
MDTKSIQKNSKRNLSFLFFAVSLFGIYYFFRFRLLIGLTVLCVIPRNSAAIRITILAIALLMATMWFLNSFFSIKSKADEIKRAIDESGKSFFDKIFDKIPMPRAQSSQEEAPVFNFTEIDAAPIIEKESEKEKIDTWTNPVSEYRSKYEITPLTVEKVKNLPSELKEDAIVHIIQPPIQQKVNEELKKENGPKYIPYDPMLDVKLLLMDDMPESEKQKLLQENAKKKNEFDRRLAQELK